MRAGRVALILMLCCADSWSFTVIMKNGKTMEGTLLSEQPDSIQFRDIYGIQYTLKKDLLNIPAMLDANPESRAAARPAAPEAPTTTSTIVHDRRPTLAEIARENLKHRTGKAPVLRNTRPREAMPTWPKTAPELADWIARTEKDLHRLAAQCRAAGANPSAKLSYRQDTYIVEGKTVVVSGYWADPEEVESARRICTQAILTEKALGLARKDLDELQQKETQAGTAGGR